MYLNIYYYTDNFIITIKLSVHNTRVLYSIILILREQYPGLLQNQASKLLENTLVKVYGNYNRHMTFVTHRIQ